MRIRGLALAAAMLGALPIGAIAQSDPAAPPPDITPTSVTLAHVVRMHRHAAGDATALEHWTLVWQITESGVSGTETDVRSGETYRRDVALGPLHRASGSFEGKAWEQNYNGEVRLLSGLHRRDDADDAALADPAAPGSGVTLLGTVSSPVNAYVLRVAPAGGRTEYVFYDAKTYLTVRIERALEDRRSITTYDDFRTQNGVTIAWHSHTADALPGDDRDMRLQSLQTGVPDAAKLQIPAPIAPYAPPHTPAALPVKMDGDRVIVTVTLGAHTVNLQLDSGSSGVLIDRSVAEAVHAQIFGARIEETAGAYTASDALLNNAQIGPIALSSFAFETAPFTWLTSDGAPVAGLLGYDFIAGSVLHVDYANGTLEAIDPATFSPPAGAVELPIRLDDGIPVIAVRIGDAVGEHFAVDTGADRSMIFSAFANAHKSEIPDQGLGEEMVDSFPFLGDIEGVGGKVTVHPVQVSSLDIGSIALPKWLFTVSQDAPAFESEDFDGLIGQDVLRYFDVYFDYSRYKLYLLPNARYRSRFGS